MKSWGVLVLDTIVLRMDSKVAEEAMDTPPKEQEKRYVNLVLWLCLQSYFTEQFSSYVNTELQPCPMPSKKVVVTVPTFGSR